jgi:hypothetical protein
MKDIEIRFAKLYAGHEHILVSEDGDIIVADPAAPVEAPVEKEKKSALEEAYEDAEPKDEHGGSKPPHNGNCRECKRDRPLNRLKLCYACFVELVLMDEAKKRSDPWKPGESHPKWCACEGLGEHTNSDGSPRGFN